MNLKVENIVVIVYYTIVLTINVYMIVSCMLLFAQVYSTYQLLFLVCDSSLYICCYKSIKFTVANLSLDFNKPRQIPSSDSELETLVQACESDESASGFGNHVRGVSKNDGSEDK